MGICVYEAIYKWLKVIDEGEWGYYNYIYYNKLSEEFWDEILNLICSIEEEGNRNPRYVLKVNYEDIDKFENDLKPVQDYYPILKIIYNMESNRTPDDPANYEYYRIAFRKILEIAEEFTSYKEELLTQFKINNNSIVGFRQTVYINMHGLVRVKTVKSDKNIFGCNDFDDFSNSNDESYTVSVETRRIDMVAVDEIFNLFNENFNRINTYFYKGDNPEWEVSFGESLEYHINGSVLDDPNGRLNKLSDLIRKHSKMENILAFSLPSINLMRRITLGINSKQTIISEQSNNLILEENSLKLPETIGFFGQQNKIIFADTIKFFELFDAHLFGSVIGYERDMFDATETRYMNVLLEYDIGSVPLKFHYYKDSLPYKWNDFIESIRKLCRDDPITLFDNQLHQVLTPRYDDVYVNFVGEVTYFDTQLIKLNDEISGSTYHIDKTVIRVRKYSSIIFEEKWI